MKYAIASLGIFLSIHPLFVFASAAGGGLALASYSSSAVFTGGTQVGGSGIAHSESGSASVEIKNTLNTDAGGTVEVKVQTEADGVVRKESVKKTISPQSGTVQVFVATSSGTGVSAHGVVWWQDSWEEASSSEQYSSRVSTSTPLTILGMLPRMFHFFTYSLSGSVSHWFSGFFSFFGRY